MNHRTLKWLKWYYFTRPLKMLQCCRRTGICPLFSSPTREIWQLKSPQSREFAIQGKKMLMPGGHPRKGGGGGGWAQVVELTDALLQNLLMMAVVTWYSVLVSKLSPQNVWWYMKRFLRAMKIYEMSKNELVKFPVKGWFLTWSKLNGNISTLYT